jgi:YjbE family integral membrane protein
MLLQWLGVIASILVVDLALSGDNALVIGAVASKLPARQQRTVIVFGGAMAIVLRIALASVAVFLLQIPYLQAVGGLIVFIIAVQIVAEAGADEQDGAPEGNAKRRRRLQGQESLLRASMLILLADVSMSLDNVLAVAALARGSYVLLALGIMFSMALLLVASSLVARLLTRFPRLLLLAGVILAWTSGTMVRDDKAINPFVVSLDQQVPGPPLVWVVPTVFVVGLAIVWLVLQGRRSRHAAKPS